MTARRRLTTAAARLAIAALGTVIVRAQAPVQTSQLADILESAGKYVAQYEQSFSAVVLEEKYSQVFSGAPARGGREVRNLKSDVLLIQGKETGWAAFRDVIEVDGKPVRDHDDRLAEMILKPSSDSREQAKRIAEEGARFNLGPISRTINTPTLALMFLRAEVQPRVDFRLGKMTRIDGAPAAEVHYVEKDGSRAVNTKDRAPASGRFWIQPATGAVLKSEFVIASTGTKGTIEVTYAHQPKLGMLIPSSMSELYEFGNLRSTRIEAKATYSNYRRFSVDTSAIVK